jgi:P2 family phage contractile tail tube protein
MQYPEMMINYMCYLNGSSFVGMVDVELPSLDALTEKIKGAGIAGEINAPVIGHFDALTLGITWRVIDANAISFIAPVYNRLDFRGSQQIYNSSGAVIGNQPVKAICRAMPTKSSLGKLVQAATTETKNEFECNYLKIFVNGDEVLELDKYNYIFTVNGVDYLADIRSDLGLSY